MLVNINSFDYKLTPNIENHVLNKLKKIRDADAINNLQVILKGTKHDNYEVKLVAHAYNHDQIACCFGTDLYLTITRAIKKMIRLLKHHKCIQLRMRSRDSLKHYIGEEIEKIIE